MDEEKFYGIQDGDFVVENLESHSSFEDSLITPKDVLNKISEFMKYLNSTGRITLLKADHEECQELVYLFLNLKKNIKSVIQEIGKCYKNKILSFVCTKCNDTIAFNNWDDFENHEHFEESLYNLMTGQLLLPLTENTTFSEHSEKLSKTHSSDNTPEHNIQIEMNSSGCDVQAMDVSNNVDNESFDTSTEHLDEHYDLSVSDEDWPLGDNTFRFNFKIKYDNKIETRLYPSKLVNLAKYDSCPFICLQKINLLKAVCLLCCVPLCSLHKFGTKHCIDHLLGQKHMKAANTEVNVLSLQKYHETFWNLETHFQAHQVHFVPNTPTTLQCHLCYVTLPIKNVIFHINSNKHKNGVIKMFNIKSTDVFLLDLQVTCYGIKVEEETKPPKEKSKEPEQNVKIKKEKKKSKELEPDKGIKHEIVLSVIDSGNNTIEDLLPRRFKAHAQYLKITEWGISCSICRGIAIQRSLQSITHHIISPDHHDVASRDIRRHKYSFYCEICNIQFSNEVSWAKHFCPEPARHSKVSKVRTERKEYECIPCQTIIYGDQISLIRHQGGAGVKKPSEILLPEDIKTLFSSRENLENTARALAEGANNTISNCTRTRTCCDRIEKILQSTFEEGKVYPFGSRISGLGNSNSDLDIFVDVGQGMYIGDRDQEIIFEGKTYKRGKHEHLLQYAILKSVVKVLKEHKDEFKSVVTVPTARTPIIKCHHIPTELDCDLSFKHGLSVENTKFLRLCIQLQPIVQELILIVKKWSYYTGLADGLTTYSLAMLCIFYMQVNGYLLSVKRVQELNQISSSTIDGWTIINYITPLEEMKKHIKHYEHTLITLLKEFFQYYEQFNYAEDLICPLLGYTIKVKVLHEDRKLVPKEMENYLAQLRTPHREVFKNAPFSIQDPFDLSHNLTKSCPKLLVEHLIKYSALSRALL